MECIKTNICLLSHQVMTFENLMLKFLNYKNIKIRLNDLENNVKNLNSELKTIKQQRFELFTYLLCVRTRGCSGVFRALSHGVRRWKLATFDRGFDGVSVRCVFTYGVFARSRSSNARPRQIGKRYQKQNGDFVYRLHFLRGRVGTYDVSMVFGVSRNFVRDF